MPVPQSNIDVYGSRPTAGTNYYSGYAATPRPPKNPVSTNPVPGTFTPRSDLMDQFRAHDQYGNPILTSAGGPNVTAATPAITAGTFTNTPTPQTGTGAFGLVPGPIGIPSPFADLSAIYPHLAEQNTALSTNISDELAGKLSPDIEANIRNAAATYGVTSGMPGSGASGRFGLYNTALASDAMKQRGLQDYTNLLPKIFATETAGPQLEAQIAAQNALNAASPNPDARAWYQRFAPKTVADQTGKGNNNDASSIIGGVGAGAATLGSLASLLALL